MPSGISLHRYLATLSVTKLPEEKNNLTKEKNNFLNSYLKYGQYLNIAQELHRQAKRNGQQVGTTTG